MLWLAVLPANLSVAQCTIDYSQTVPGVYPDTLMPATVNQPYSQDITFVLITDTLGLTIYNFQIVSITGLPVGITWQCNHFANGCNYNPAVTLYGCIGLSGTPLIAGTYHPVVTVVASVQLVGNQTITYSMPLVVLPDSSTNAGFSMSASSGCEPLTITFTNNNPGQTAYLWDFGDGMLSTLENPPPHTYSSAGTYIVTLTITPNGSPQYFLTGITITSIPNNYGAPLDVPDMYFYIHDPQGNQIYDSHPAVLNTHPPHYWPLPNIPLSNGNYAIHVWDEDGGLFGGDDYLGMVTFPGWSNSGTATGTLPGVSGSLNINYDILVIPVVPLIASDTVVVYPTPTAPLITASGPLIFCEEDSVTLTYQDTLAIQWYKNAAPITGATSPSLTIYESGNYSAIVTNAYGCTATSAIFSVTVNPKPPKPTFFILGNTFHCMLTGYMLQWYLNGNPLPGQTGSSYTATVAGTYQVSATDSLTGCMNFSDTLYFVPVATGMIDPHPSIVVFPNPSHGIFTLLISTPTTSELNYSVRNLTGRKITEGQWSIINGMNSYLLHLKAPPGIYLLYLYSDNFQTIRRLIIE
jgi:PKD repeat protein